MGMTINDIRLLIHDDYKKFHEYVSDDNISKYISRNILGFHECLKDDSIKLIMLYYYAISSSMNTTIPEYIKELIEDCSREYLIASVVNNPRILEYAIKTIIKIDISESELFNLHKHYSLLANAKPSPVYSKLHPSIEKEMKSAEDYGRTRIIEDKIIKTKIRTFADFLSIYFGNYNTIEQTTNRLVILRAIIDSITDEQLKDKIKKFIISNYYSIGCTSDKKEVRKNTTDFAYETLKDKNNISNEMLLIFSCFSLDTYINQHKKLKKSDIKDLQYIRNYKG